MTGRFKFPLLSKLPVAAGVQVLNGSVRFVVDSTVTAPPGMPPVEWSVSVPLASWLESTLVIAGAADTPVTVTLPFTASWLVFQV